MKKMSGNDFDSLVPFFDNMAQTKWLSSIHNQIKSLTGSWENKDVLDIGCGTGRLLARGLSKARSLVGIDLSEEMVYASKDLLGEASKTTIRVVVGDAYQLPLAEEEVDIALSTCVMFLLPEPLKGLAEMKRVLRLGGVVGMLNPSPNMSLETAKQYVTVHNMEGFERESLLAWSNVSTKRHRYSQTQFVSTLEGLGFTSCSNVDVLDGLATITIARK